MNIMDEMDQLRGLSTGCDLAAYTDLSTGLVLGWSSATACPREVLDSLGARATACFALAHEISPDETPVQALHFTARRTEVFGRADAQSDEAMCLAAPAGSDAARLLAMMSADQQTSQGAG